MRVLQQARVPFRSPSGLLLGYVKFTATNEASGTTVAPIIELDEIDAAEHGETVYQLRESEYYEYEVETVGGSDLRLRSSLAKRRRSLGLAAHPDAGLLETRSFCGTLVLELVEGPLEPQKNAVGSALIDVRSVKLDYRTEYRGMVRRMADELASLAVDSRSSIKTSFVSNFEARSEPGWLQLQLELLREILEGNEFAAALQRIIIYPHERLSTALEQSPIDLPINWTGHAIRQLARSSVRRKLPIVHPLRTRGLETVPEHINVAQHFKDLDTPENRFVKHVLLEFRAFASSAAKIFEITAGWGASNALANRLLSILDSWLGRSMFQEVGTMRFAPLGSSVLQRKAGYREVMRWWLRSRTAAELSWKGGEDAFRAGQRDAASLYEYWLFFELLGWFCKTCCGGQRPPIESLIDGLDSSSPNLKLKKKVELGPFVGAVSGIHRSLSTKFSYNRRFPATGVRSAPGSWTRALHPDYTFSFWPSVMSESEAEARELLVHIHFDAKYRVDDVKALFGGDTIGDEQDGEDGNYNRHDLMKMHAYRDAIKRSQGAYVLYPGREHLATRFSGFHEILPGLGAFSISPDEDGSAKGIGVLEKFLAEVLKHLADRTTALDRISYHTSESYSDTKRPLMTAQARWSEMEQFSGDRRAPPPSEHFVAVFYTSSFAAFNWCLLNSLVPVPLDDQSEAGRIPIEFSASRHVAVSNPSAAKSFCLWKRLSRSLTVISGSNLASMGYPVPGLDRLYALLDASPDAEWETMSWSWRAMVCSIRIDRRRKLGVSESLGNKVRKPYAITLLTMLEKNTSSRRPDT